MKLNKISLAVGIFAVLITLIISDFLESQAEQQEKVRLSGIITPVVIKAVENLSEPRPLIADIDPATKSLMLVLRWEQKVDVLARSDVRERVSNAVRRELSSDPASWGRRLSVIFDDEVITQGGR